MTYQGILSAIGNTPLVELKRLIPGFGAGFRPELCRLELVSRCVHVSDTDCVVGCHRLLHAEGLLVGGSSGGVLSAVDRLKDEIPEGAHCVMILPDRGERYLDTIYSDDWVYEHLDLPSGLGLEPWRTRRASEGVREMSELSVLANLMQLSMSSL
jgi:N-(2-amino-2-carboxyethyl)-L-glutamate synthase